jgi:8-oxo-dGTP pyrophosphatase MutT (NUDIX family)
MPRRRARFPEAEALEAALALGLHPVVGTAEIDAATMICLRAGPAGDEVLLCRRARRAGDPWSGHMGLPGGRRERGDGDALATAARETAEEVGFDPRTVGRILGALPVLETRRRDFHVRVALFVARVPRTVEPHVSDELEAAWWVALGELRPARVQVPEVPVPVPAYLAPSPDGEPAVVWGMTFRMLTLLRQAGAPPRPSARFRT